MNKDLFGNSIIQEKISFDPCQECPLFRSESKPVLPFGNLETAKIAMVGEAPGEVEERKGVPFVGPAGQQLRGVLKEVGIDEGVIYFTNTIKCRPPNNRNPEEKEIGLCRKKWKDRLDNFPGLVVLLGNIALKAFLGKTGIKNNRGYGFFKNGVHYFATYHPSYILHKHEDKEVYNTFYNDMKKVKAYIDRNHKVPYTAILDLQQLDEMIIELKNMIQDKDRILSVDLETAGLDPFKEEEKVLSLSITVDGEKSWFIPLEHPQSPFLGNSKEAMDRIGFLFTSDRVKIIGQNFKFDMRFLFLNYGITVTNFWFDAEIAHFILEGNLKPHGLKSCAWKYTDLGGYDVDTTRLSVMDLEEVGKYNVMDSYVAAKLADVYMKKMNEKQRQLVTEILAPAVMAITEIELSGLLLDEKQLKKSLDDYTSRVMQVETRLRNNEVVKEMERKNAKMFNFNSIKQLRELLERLSIHPEKRTPGGMVSTDKETLKAMKDKHPIIRNIMDYRKLNTIINTYLSSYSKIAIDGVIHGDYSFTTAITGRLACSSPNLQNVPYDTRVVFQSRNGVFLECDYSQMELRVLAAHSKDENLIKVFNEGMDIHEQTRQKIFGSAEGLSVSKRKKQRVKAKGVNFGIVYQEGASSLAKDLGVSLVKAQEYIDAVYGAYPKIQDYIKAMKRAVFEPGYVETFFGRKRWFNVSGNMTEGRRNSFFRQAVNTPIQSTASDIVLFATGKLWRAMKEKGFKSNLCAHGYDAILLDAYEDEASMLALLAKHIMETVSFPFMNVPLKVDISIGTHWGNLEKLKMS